MEPSALNAAANEVNAKDQESPEATPTTWMTLSGITGCKPTSLDLDLDITRFILPATLLTCV